MKTPNEFQILGITPTDNQDIIKQAYTKLVKQHHPDVGGDPIHLQQIIQAYETLSKTDIHTTIAVSLKNLLTGAKIYGIVNGIKFVVTIPPFTYPGSVLQFTDGKTVNVRIIEQTHPQWKRNDDTIVIEKLIGPWEAQKGVTCVCKNFDDQIHTVIVPPKTLASRITYDFPRQGFIKRGGIIRGNLQIIINIWTP